MVQTVWPPACARGDQAVGVVGDDVLRLGEVVVGEVRAHPRLAHHAGRQLDHLVELRVEHPGVVAELQRGVAGVLGRGGEAHQGVVVAARPGLHLQAPLPGRPVDGHRHGRLRALRAIVVEGLPQDRVGVRRRRQRRGTRRPSPPGSPTRNLPPHALAALHSRPIAGIR